MERDLLTSMVENVLHVSQVNCRRKKKLIKIWHKPKPGENQWLSTKDKVKVLVGVVVVWVVVMVV